MKVCTSSQTLPGATLRPTKVTSAISACKLLFLRLLVLMVLGFCFNANATGLQQGITLSEKNASLERVLQKIRKQSNYLILYNNELLQKAKPVTIEAKNLSVEEVLRLCLKGQPFIFELIDQTILIKPLPEIKSSRVQPPSTIKGRVLDDKGEPLPGASVVVKGTSNAAMTSANGEFELRGVEDNATLVISFIGFKTKEVAVTSATQQYTITLELDDAKLEEVVVVGYGTQKREEITGAISQVGAEVFENRPITSLAQGLQGALPNLNISFGDGQLNRGADFNLRGFTSVNGGGPLILIDGTPGNVELLNPEDVESVTVLKDAASAAVYGARAAFGVVLITTRTAKSGRPQIRYTNNFGWGKPTRRPEVVTDPLTAARIQNEAYRGFSGSDAPGMVAIIDYLERRQQDPSLPELGIDPAGNFIRGASTDWYNEFYNDNAAFSKHYLSFSGTEGKTGYFLSLGYQTQEGIFKVATDDYKRYSMRLKLNNQVFDWLNVYNNAEFSQGVYDTPNKLVSEGGYNVYRYLSLYANPYEAIRTANGNYTMAGMTTFGQLESAGRTIEKNQVLRNTLGLKTGFFNNKFRINGDYTIFVNQARDEIKYNRLEYENRANQLVNWTNPDYYRTNFGENFHHILNAYAEYENDYGDHHAKIMVGYNQELLTANSFYSRRDDNISPDLGSIDLTTGVTQVGDSKSAWALRGVFGRFNYDYKGRYLFEANARYDGTSRFPKVSRFGFFPSVSVGWVLSKEEFLQSVFNESSLFKLRASYGELGNQAVSTYAYINTMSVNQGGDVLDGQYQLYTRAPALAPYNLTWETAATLNFGFDLSILRGRLNAGFDWYNRKTKDMLTRGRTVPAVLGTSSPRQNAADLSTKGWEASISWSDKINFSKPLTYSISFVLADNKSVITKYDNPNQLLNDYYVGMELGEIWGYNTLGFFQSDEEYRSHADQSRVQSIVYSLNGHPLAGDLKFEDRNNDGSINFGENTASNPGDMYKIGNTTPRYLYGINTGFSWSNFTLDVFLQGVGKRDFWPGTESAVFWGFYNRWNQPVMKHIEGNYWTPENPNAYFPRLRSYMALNDTRSLGVTQTRYLQDASYLRLKNVTVGYNIPQKFTKLVKLQKARVFFAGANLYEFSNISEAYDPEGLSDELDGGRSNGNGFVYPIQRTYTFGIEINL